MPPRQGLPFMPPLVLEKTFHFSLALVVNGSKKIDKRKAMKKVTAYIT